MISAPTPLFLTSGDLLADRRYELARRFEAEGDLAAAADLLFQAIERAPGFASAWFALGEIREQAGDGAGAIAAFRNTLTVDPADSLGAALRLARLGAVEAEPAMSAAYVRTLFDQYAPRFDDALVEALSYRGPALLHGAVARVLQARGRPFRFARMIDLGCGTGLGGEAFRDACGSITGFDLSPVMVEAARRRGTYHRLAVGDMVALLAREVAGGCDLIVAADALVYVADLAPVCRAAAYGLETGGLFAFTVETHGGAGVVLGDKLRYAHGEDHVRLAVEQAGLRVLALDHASTRTENGAPVPGFVVVVERVSAWTDH